MDSFTVIVLLILVCVIFFWVRAGNKRKEKEKNERLKQKQLVASAKAYIEEAKTNKRLPAGFTSIMLGEGEQAFFEEETKLIETRSVRNTGGGGVRFRVAKGVSVGGFGAQGESHQAYRIIDQGKITLTNKKIFFSGSKENRNIPINKIIKFDPMTDGAEIGIESRSKNICFYIGNAFLWGAVVNILHSANGDVSNLSPEVFDKSLEWLKDWEIFENELTQNN